MRGGGGFGFARRRRGGVSGGGAVIGTPPAPSSFIGMNVIDHYRSYGDVANTDLYQGDDHYYINASGLVRVPDANRDANGWVISNPADQIGTNFYYVIRYPLNTGASAFTWTGNFPSLSMTGPNVSIGSIGANSATITFTATIATNPGNAQIVYDINPANPPKNWSIIPAGRNAADIWTPEAEAALDLYMGAGAYRPIKHFPHVEGGWAVTQRNTPSSAVWWGNDGVPFEHELTRAANRGKPIQWNIGLLEADSVIIAKADLLKAHLLVSTSRRALLESGNEPWNSGLYYANHVTLSALAVTNGLDTTNAAGAVISSITHVGTTATVTTATAHGRTTGQRVTIHGALPIEYSFYPTEAITVTDATHFTYPLYSVPATNATSVGVLRVGATAGDLFQAQLQAHSLRSSAVMDLIESRLGSPLMRAQVVRLLGGQNAGPANNLVEMNYSTTAAKHDALAIGAYWGGKYDVYPVDGMSRGSPAPYTAADFPNILIDTKLGVDGVFALTSQNIVNAALKGLKLTGYEFGIDRSFSGNAVAITAITRAGTVATVQTAAAHNMTTGDQITKSGTTPTGFDLGTRTAVTVIDATHYSYNMAADPGGNATVVGAYKNYGPQTRWYNSQQSYDLTIYALQEWQRITLGANPSIMPFSNANWYVELGDIDNENGAGRSLIRYLGDAVSSKGQALIDFNGNLVRKPNALVGTLVGHVGDANGTVWGTFTKFVVGSTITVQAVSGGGNPAAFAVGNTTTTPTAALTVANAGLIPAAGSYTVTLRETNPLFPAPGYLDTVVALPVAPAILSDNFNAGSLDGAKWSVGTDMSANASSVGMTAVQTGGKLVLTSDGTTGRGVSVRSVNTVDLTLNPRHFMTLGLTGGSDQGFVVGTPSGHFIQFNRRNDGFLLAYHWNGTTFVGTEASVAGKTVAAWPHMQFRYDPAGPTLNIDLKAPGGDPTLSTGWDAGVLSFAVPGYITATAVNVGFNLRNDFGIGAGDNLTIEGFNSAP